MAIEITTNNSQKTYCPTYSVQIPWPESTDTSDTMSDEKVATMSDDISMQSTLEQLRSQYLTAKVFALHSSDTLTTLLQLETAVSQYIETFYAQLHQIPDTELSHEAVAAIVIRIQGPVHIPLDFTLVQLPLRDSESQPHTSASMNTSDDTAVLSAILYVTAQRPTAIDFKELVSHNRGIYQLQSPVPMVAAYYHDTANGVTEDVQIVQNAIYNAIEHVLHTTPLRQYDHANLAACISNTILVDRASIATNSDRTACDILFEQVRYATTEEKLLQWRTLLEMFCVKANGLKDVICTYTKGSTDIAKQACTDCWHTLSTTATTYHATMFDAIQQKLAGIETSGDFLNVASTILNWAAATCKQLLQDFGRYAAAILSTVITDTATALDGDMHDTMLRCFTDHANSEVRLSLYSLPPVPVIIIIKDPYTCWLHS
jgi:hypothetical protein